MPISDFAFNATLQNEDPGATGVVERDSNGAQCRFGLNEASYPNDPIYTMDYAAALARARVLYNDRWEDDHLDLIQNPFIAAKMFDLSFNIGLTWGVIFCQRALKKLGCDLGTSGKDGDGVDGVLGTTTAAAANAADPQNLMAGIVDAGATYYSAVVAAHPDDQQYLKGWDLRLAKNTQVS